MKIQHKTEYPVDKGGTCMDPSAVHTHRRSKVLDLQCNFWVAVRMTMRK